MLKLQNIHTYYGESHILQGLSLEVPAGSLIALLGRNGMGKTTAIHTIMGLQTSRSGSIIFKGADITVLPSFKIARMGMAIVPQGRRIFPSLTVKENLMLGLGSRRGKEGTAEMDCILDLFPVLRVRSGQQGQYLSGGEQEMLCIGRALVSNPDLILMDEPFEGLAPIIVVDLVQKLKVLKQQGRSILLVEQNVPTALQIADYVYVLEKGRIVLEGTPKEVSDRNNIQKYVLGF